jgi:hypothetical protein
VRLGVDYVVYEAAMSAEYPEAAELVARGKGTTTH